MTMTRAQSQTCQSGVQSTRHHPNIAPRNITNNKPNFQNPTRLLGNRGHCYIGRHRSLMVHSTKIKQSRFEPWGHFSKAPENFWACFVVLKVSRAFEKWTPSHGNCVVFLNKTLLLLQYLSLPRCINGYWHN